MGLGSWNIANCHCLTECPCRLSSLRIVASFMLEIKLSFSDFNISFSFMPFGNVLRFLCISLFPAVDPHAYNLCKKLGYTIVILALFFLEKVHGLQKVDFVCVCFL